MFRWSDQDPTFLLSSDDEIPVFAFRGQCFVGDDLVVGSEGAAAFEARGGAIPPGEDGSYAVLRRTGECEWTLGTDYKGFTHVFYRREPTGEWAVSNSLLALYWHLGQRGWNVEPNPASIAAFGANINMVRTLMSYDTPIRGVRLLPSSTILVLKPGPAPTLHEREVSVEAPPERTYESALGTYLDVWSRRLRTLAHDPRLDVNLHVTGGRDSRTVLAMMLASVSTDRRSIPSRVRFTSQPDRSDDLAVATMLASRYGFNLNMPPTGELPPVIGPGRSARQWAETSVGCYSHIMFPARERSAFRVTVPGVGGEAHRWVYREAFSGMPIDAIADHFKNGFRQPEVFDAWRCSLVEADERLSRMPAAHPEPMVRSHREFRDRFHSGKENFYVSASIPLSSKYLTTCSNLLPPSRFATGQILVDIMSNTNRELVSEPYDMPAKMPTARELRSAVDLRWSPPTGEGRVFSAEEESFREPEMDEETGRTPLSYVLETAVSSLWSPAALDLLGRRPLREGVRTLVRSIDAKRQNLHHDGRRAHLAYLAATLLGDA